VAKREVRRRTRLDATAETIGTALAKIVNKVERWRTTRDSLAAEVRHVVDAGNKMLAELGHRGDTGSTRTRKSGQGPFNQPRLVRAKPGKPGKKRTISAEGKARIAAGQRKRWEEYRKKKSANR
jgi:hypothetical protein